MRLSKRRLKALEYAENVCRAYRLAISKRVVDVTQQDWDLVLELLLRWMDHSGQKSKYAHPTPPKGWPKKTQ